MNEHVVSSLIMLAVGFTLIGQSIWEEREEKKEYDRAEMIEAAKKWEERHAASK